MLIRRETAADVELIRAVHRAAFPEPVEAGLVDELRADEGWLPALSLVAEANGAVVGHVVCTRAWVTSPTGRAPALGLGPLSVRPDRQRTGVGGALMHAVLGAAEALDESLVVLLGHLDYYPRFGFRPAADLGITPPDPNWGNHFQARALTTAPPSGAFHYAAPFTAL